MRYIKALARSLVLLCDINAERETEAPDCPECGARMVIHSTIAKLGGLPQLRTFWCEVCGEVLTEDAPPERKAVVLRIGRAAPRRSAMQEVDADTYLALAVDRLRECASVPALTKGFPGPSDDANLWGWKLSDASLYLLWIERNWLAGWLGATHLRSWFGEPGSC